MLDIFLAKEEWRKYQLLKMVEHSSSLALSKKKLMVELEISNYVLKSMINQLLLDLEKCGLSKEIHLVVDKTFVHVEITGTVSSETLLEKYVEESISFNILLGAVSGKFKSLNDFSEKKRISYPIVHKTCLKLNTFLTVYDLIIDKNFCFSGKSERNIRMFLTELFARIYKENYHIFNVSHIGRVQRKENLLKTDHLTLHQKLNLMHYLYITSLRVLQEKYIEIDAPVLSKNKKINSALSDDFFYQVPDTYLKAEVERLFSYYKIHFQELDSNLKQPINPKIIEKSKKLLVELIEAFPSLVNEQEGQTIFLNQSHTLHSQILETSSAYEIVQPEINIIYFKQNYPSVLAFCRNYINCLKDTDPELYKKKNSLLLQYIFLILSAFPNRVFSELIYIYVDFSLGKLYNQFIIRNLDFFQLIGAAIVADIVSSDILLTDSRDLRGVYNKECIVWLTPPRSVDWSNLGQKVIQVRTTKNKELECLRKMNT